MEAEGFSVEIFVGLPLCAELDSLARIREPAAAANRVGRPVKVRNCLLRARQRVAACRGKC
jgi:hypothetical protein